MLDLWPAGRDTQQYRQCRTFWLIDGEFGQSCVLRQPNEPSGPVFVSPNILHYPPPPSPGCAGTVKGLKTAPWGKL